MTNLIVPEKYNPDNPLNIYREILQMQSIEHILNMTFPWKNARGFKEYLREN